MNGIARSGVQNPFAMIVGAFDADGKMIGIVFETATPFDTPQQMTELVAWLNQARELRRLHPLIIVALFIVVFLAIHPFQDGNGRLSRVLTTLLLLQAGYAYMPYSSAGERCREQQGKTITWPCARRRPLSRTAAPNWQPWLLFFMRSLQQQEAQAGREGRAQKRMRSRFCRNSQ